MIAVFSRNRLPGWALLAPIVLVCGALPTPNLSWQLAVCVPLITVFGVPHGATDWKLADLVLRGRFGRGWVLVFAALYGVLMLAVALAAWSTPQAAMVVFLAIAVWHFGAEDAGALGLRPGPAEFIACGSLPVLAPALFWPNETTMVLNSLGVVPANAVGLVHGLGAAAVGVCMVASAMAFIAKPGRAPQLAGELLALLILQLVTPPLVSFAAYFCLIHAPRHMRSLPAAVHGWETSAVSIAATLIVGGTAYALARHANADLSWASTNGLFWGLAALTLPHVVLALAASRVLANAAAPMGRGVTGKLAST